MEDIDLLRKFSNIAGGLCLVALTSFSAPGVALAGSYHSDRIEVAFVLDTTGSMANLIDGAKRKIWSIANTIVDINPNADVRMALVAYRDFGDDYVVRTFNMSADIQGLYGNLIRFQAAGGGDGPEAVNEALHASINDLDWSYGNGTKRMVFLVGDAPPHMDYDNGPKYPEVLHDARADGIIVHAVQAGSSRQTRNIWTDIAQRGGGDYISIPQDGGQISQIQTPYDDEILELQKRLDRTVVPYGDSNRQEEFRAKMRTKMSASPSVSVENSKFYAKRKGRKEVVTGGGDIISAIKNNDLELGDVRAEELPEEMRSMSEQEQKSYVADKIAEREKLEADMAELVKKHDEFVNTKQSEMARSDKKDSFDEAVSKAIRKTY